MARMEKLRDGGTEIAEGVGGVRWGGVGEAHILQRSGVSRKQPLVPSCSRESDALHITSQAQQKRIRTSQCSLRKPEK